MLACHRLTQVMRAAPSPSPRFDLQGHSTVSDGELPPAAVVQAAAASGLELFALTDHDSLAGIGEAEAAAAGSGLRLLTGVEMSVLDPAATDLHVCGYRIDPTDPALLAALERSRNDRAARLARMAQALRQLGWHVDERPLAQQLTAGLSVGRPHLAAAVVGDEHNAERLAQERLRNPTEFLVAHLTQGKPAFCERAAPTMAEVIALIHAAGGLAVWAHPFWDLAGEAEVTTALRRFAAAGLDGVEAFYVTHTRAQTGLLVSQARALGLITTGSSDFHGPSHTRFGSFRAFHTFGYEPDLGPLTG